MGWWGLITNECLLISVRSSGGVDEVAEFLVFGVGDVEDDGAVVGPYLKVSLGGLACHAAVAVASPEIVEEGGGGGGFSGGGGHAVFYGFGVRRLAGGIWWRMRWAIMR